LWLQNYNFFPYLQTIWQKKAFQKRKAFIIKLIFL